MTTAAFTDQLSRVQDRRLDELIPSDLIRAVMETLDVDGVAITLSQPLVRLPLGHSGPEAATAEATQVSLGEGPCLTAAETDRVVAVGERAMADRWPSYHRDLLRSTSFRAVTSLPMRRADGGPFGALSLYQRRSVPSGLPGPIELQADIADVVAAILVGALAALDETPFWLDTESLRARLLVWTAVGMAMEVSGDDDRRCLAVLRRYARSHGLTLDQLSGRLADRDITVQAVTGS